MYQPFGNYELGTPGHVLNALCAEGIPMHVAESVTIGEKEIRLNGKLFAMYKYFFGLDKPFFYFYDTVYKEHNLEGLPDGKFKPHFKLSLSNHLTVGLVIHGQLATEELHHFISSMLTNVIADPLYKLHKDACAFFQGGSENPKGKYIYIEFWKPESAQAFVDYINNNFVYEKIPETLEG